MAEGRTISIEDLLFHQAWLRRLAGGLVRGGADAEDLVQETWLAAIRKPPSHDRSEKGWLATVVRNAANQLRRGERARRRREHATAVAEFEEDSSRLAERVEMQHRVAREVLALDEPWRSVVLLRYFDDLSSAEVARRLGVPSSTVRNRLKRALEILRERLDDGSDGDRRRWVLALVPLIGLDREAAPRTTVSWVLPVVALTVVLVATLCAVYVSLPTAEDPAPPDLAAEAMSGVSVLDAAHEEQTEGTAVSAPAADGAGRTLSLSGRVTFARGGAPCAEAQVVADPESRGLGRYGKVEPFTTETDEEGHYEFFDLPKGLYTIIVHPEEAPTAQRPDVRVGADGAKCDLRILPGVRLFGRVLAADTGAPVPGAELSVFGSPRLVSVSDEEGRYEIRGFPRGTRFPSVGFTRGGVLAVKPPAASNLLQPGGRVEHGLKVPHDPGGGDIEFDVRLERGGALEGRVIGPDGRGVAGVRVTRDLLVDQDYYQGPTAVTGPGGGFLLTNLEAHAHRLCARKAGYPVAEVASLPVVAGKVTEGPVIRLSRGGQVSGRLIGEDGRPASGVLIFYRQKAGRNREVHGLNPDPQVTDAVGAFRFTGVPGGEAWLEICTGEYMAATHDGIDLDEGGVLEDLSITLRRGISISGRVARKNGSPVVAAWVTVEPLFTPRSPGLMHRFVIPSYPRTDGEGRFRVSGLPEGRYRIGTTGAGKVEWGPGDPEPVFRLEEVADLQGRVLDENGRPPEYFEVRCYRIDRPGGYGAAVGREDGGFTVTEIPPGTYRITATDGDGSTAVGEGATGETIHLVLAHGGLLRGTVRDLGGRLACSGTIAVRPTEGGGGQAMSGKVNESGAWAAGPLSPGSWEILARDGRGEARAVVKVEAGKTLTRDLQLDCGRAIAVVVVDQKGNPVGGVEVDLRAAGGGIVQVGDPKLKDVFERRSRDDPEQTWENYERSLRTTSWRGLVVIHDLEPGEYIVSVRGKTASVSVSEKHCARASFTVER
ncbi:MAG: sigma-70 family RNA polymerase sigma factor [Planctomycetota bacterium]